MTDLDKGIDWHDHFFYAANKTDEHLVTLLKNGEYDGADLMQAWIRIEEKNKQIEALKADIEHLSDRW